MWWDIHFSPTSITHFIVASKHIMNAQVSIRAPCCKQWYDCAECHGEAQMHPLAKTMEMSFICKKCRKAFRKDMLLYEESDEYCPHCDNHYVRFFWLLLAFRDYEREALLIGNRSQDPPACLGGGGRRHESR